MTWLRACPRCRGDLHLESDRFGEFVWEIPKTATGEILRRELIQRERAQSEEPTG